MNRGDDGSAQRRQALAAAVEQVAHGDRAALKTVYDMTSAKLLGVILRIVRDRETSEDVLQDVYVKVWRRAGRFDPAVASPVTWLCVIARNAAIDCARRESRGDPVVSRPAEAMEEIEDDTIAGILARDPEDPANDFLCDMEDHERVRLCIEQLQNEHRRTIRLAFFDGLSHSQLAERIGAPLGTVKSWIRRGLASLKGCLGGE